MFENDIYNNNDHVYEANDTHIIAVLIANMSAQIKSQFDTNQMNNRKF